MGQISNQKPFNYITKGGRTLADPIQLDRLKLVLLGR